MTADVEDEYIVAQANEPLDENGHFVNEKVSVRYRDERPGGRAATRWTTWMFPPRWWFPLPPL